MLSNVHLWQLNQRPRLNVCIRLYEGERESEEESILIRGNQHKSVSEQLRRCCCWKWVVARPTSTKHAVSSPELTAFLPNNLSLKGKLLMNKIPYCMKNPRRGRSWCTFVEQWHISLCFNFNFWWWCKIGSISTLKKSSLFLVGI